MPATPRRPGAGIGSVSAGGGSPTSGHAAPVPANRAGIGSIGPPPGTRAGLCLLGRAGPVVRLGPGDLPGSVRDRIELSADEPGAGSDVDAPAGASVSETWP